MVATTPNWVDLKDLAAIYPLQHHDGPKLGANDLLDSKEHLPTEGKLLDLLIERMENTVARGDDREVASANQLARHIAAKMIEQEEGTKPDAAEQQASYRLISIIKATEPYAPLATLQGAGKGVVDTAEGLAAPFLHLDDTVAGIKQLISHPLDTLAAMQTAERHELATILRNEDSSARQAAFAEGSIASTLNTFLNVAGGVGMAKTAAHIGNAGLHTIKNHLDNPPPGTGGAVTAEGIRMDGLPLAATKGPTQGPGLFALGAVNMASNAGQGPSNGPEQPSPASLAEQDAMTPEARRKLIIEHVNQMLGSRVPEGMMATDPARGMRPTIEMSLEKIVASATPAAERNAEIAKLWQHIQRLAPENTDITAWALYGGDARMVGELLEAELNAANTGPRLELDGLAAGRIGTGVYFPDRMVNPEAFARSDAAFTNFYDGLYEYNHPGQSVIARVPLTKNHPAHLDAPAILVITEDVGFGFKKQNAGAGTEYGYNFGEKKYTFLRVEGESTGELQYKEISMAEVEKLVGANVYPLNIPETPAARELYVGRLQRFVDACRLADENQAGQLSSTGAEPQDPGR